MTYPVELDTNDTEALAAYIERRYPAEQLRIHENETIRFTYWDVSHRSVSSEFLDHIQQAGYRYTPRRRCNGAEMGDTTRLVGMPETRTGRERGRKTRMR